MMTARTSLHMLLVNFTVNFMLVECTEIVMLQKLQYQIIKGYFDIKSEHIHLMQILHLWSIMQYYSRK